ncbi:MAG: AAA family ATPase [Candidatus Brocadiales bacterium]|nr:AAA family ATPase [Candidatus Brocadiales bacterium]
METIKSTNNELIAKSDDNRVATEIRSLLAKMEQDELDDQDERSILKSTFLLSQQDLCNAVNKTPQAMSKYATSKKISTKKINSKNRGYSNKDVRLILESFGFHYPSYIIAFQMLKGGSTKTIALVHLAIRLCHYGAKVCVIDLDPQGNSTEAFAVDTSERPIFYDIAVGNVPIKDAIVNINEGLDIIPSDFGNSGLDHFITSKQRNLGTFVSSHVSKIKSNYDFILIDCNPSLSHINTSIALASDYLMVPVNPNKFSYNGLVQTLKELLRINEEFKSEIDFKLLYTLYKERDNLSQKYLIKYGKNLKNKLVSAIIKENTDVKKAIDEKKFIFDKPKALSRQDFDLFALETLGLNNFSKENLH